MRTTTATTIFSVGILISFFLPWIDLGFYSLNGFEIPTSLDKLIAVNEVFSNNNDVSYLKLSYIMYLIPLFALINVIMDVSKANFRTQLDEFGVGIIVAILLFVFIQSINERAASTLTIGYYLTALFSLLGIFSFRKKQKTEATSPVIKEPSKEEILSNDKSSLLNQLSQLHSLREKNVISEEIYEQERQIIIGKLQPQEQTKEKEPQTETIIQKPSFEPSITEETYDREYERLFLKKKWYQKPVFWIVSGVTVLAAAGFTFLKTSNNGSLPEPYSNTSLYKLDTTIKNVNVNGEKYSFKAFYERNQSSTIAAQDDEEYKSVSFLFFKENSQKPELIKSMSLEEGEFIHYNVYKGQNQSLDKDGRLYLLINKSFGGSGSSSEIYTVSNQDGKVSMEKIFECSGELDYKIYKKNDDEILLLQGIWGDNESHFANHRYLVKNYKFENGSFKEITIGKTKYKYSSLDEDKPVEQILIDMKTKEPLLFQSINISDYKF